MEWTPKKTFQLANAMQVLALINYPIMEDSPFPSDEIALSMGKIAGLCHNIKQACIDLDPTIRNK